MKLECKSTRFHIQTHLGDGKAHTRARAITGHRVSERQGSESGIDQVFQSDRECQPQDEGHGQDIDKGQGKALSQREGPGQAEGVSQCHCTGERNFRATISMKISIRIRVRVCVRLKTRVMVSEGFIVRVRVENGQIQ